jgi:XTP/dITP diphosphohydrolase
LREKCPWDRKQTIQSLRQQTIEETYELTDAITEEDWKGIKEELGDLLLHILFYSKIGSEQGRFSLAEVINGISDKLVSRHPHVYGDAAGEKVLVKDEEELPALVKAMRLQEKAKQVGFEWDNKEQVWDKVEEESRELKEAEQLNSPARMEEEMGDLLFSLINYARFLQVDAENALEKTNKKFIYRFTQMEKQAALTQRTLAGMSLAEMDALWNSVKKQTP